MIKKRGGIDGCDPPGAAGPGGGGGAAPTGGIPPWAADLKGPLCLVLGSEGEGLRPLVARACDVIVSVPMRGGVGSLNVAGAGAALCYEVARQRAQTGKTP